MAEASKQPTCEQRVGPSLDSTIDDIRLMFWGAREDDLELTDDGTLDTVIRVGDEEFRYDADAMADYRDEDGDFDMQAFFDDFKNEINYRLSERWFEYGLSFDYVAAGTFSDQDQGYFRYQLSCGGPSTEFRFFVDPDLTCWKIEYWFLDWWDGACRTLHGDDKKLMLDVFEQFKDCGTLQVELERSRED